MLLIALGLVAVVALVLGLALANSLWLIVSLAASLIALLTLFVLVRRERASERKAVAAKTAPPGVETRTDTDASTQSAPAEAGERPTVTAQAGEVLVVDEHPEYHSNGCPTLVDRPRSELFAVPRQQALEDGFTPCGTCAPDGADFAGVTQQPGAPALAEPVPVVAADVWVVDGRPEYHAEACEQLTGADAQRVPLAQAVEDGFAPCQTCTPAGATVRQVWVADGHPEFHDAGCRRLQDLPGEAVPYSQAVEDGFAPCPVCQPEEAGAGSAPVAAVVPITGAADAAAVWVVDGHPEYHLESCTRLAGLGAEAVPRAQAREDGFTPCAVCAPDGVEALPPDEVWVADGYAEFHVAGCHELNGRPGEPVALAQAVEDGFTPCAICRPDQGVAATGTTTKDGAAAAPAARADVAPNGQVWVIDGLPSFHRSSCKEITGLAGEAIPFAQAVEDGFQPCTVCRPGADPVAEPVTAAEPVAEVSLLDELTSSTPVEAEVEEPQAAEPEVEEPDVLVVDGFPDFHRRGCVRIDGLQIETIGFGQAVEDGFQPCDTCTPTRENAGTVAPPAAQPPERAGAEDEPDLVCVVDGQLYYHRETCPELIGLAGELIPRPQANEDGFVRCDVCRPDDVNEPAGLGQFTDDAGAAPGDARQVLVVDGQPNYHRRDCERLAGLVEIEIPHPQAIEDGFAPCPVCRPDDEHAPVEPEVGEPATQVEPAAEPEPEPDREREPVAAVEPEPVVEPVPEPEPVREPEPVVAVEPEPAVERVPEPEPVREPEPVAAVEPEPAVEPVPEPGPVREPEPVAAAISVPEPVAVSVGAPAAESSLVAAAPLGVSTGEDASDSAAERTDEAEAGERLVYVLEGRPRFHTADCLIIKGQPSQEMTYDKAVAEQLNPCSLCSR